MSQTPSGWVPATERRLKAVDKRMQYLQDAIDQRTHWMDATKARIEVLEARVADLAERLDKSAAAHADEFSEVDQTLNRAEKAWRDVTARMDALEERLGRLEKKTGFTEETP